MKVSEEMRLQAIKELQILDTVEESEFNDITRIAAVTCNTPISMISIVDKERQWFKATYGLKLLETPRDVSFCSHAIQKPDELMVVRNTLSDERFKNNPYVHEKPNMRFYAGMPIVTDTGQAIGTVCVIDGEPKELTPDQEEVLRLLSKQTMKLLYWRLAKGVLREKDCFGNENLRALMPVL
jgi:GAF domain-containing protein